MAKLTVRAIEAARPKAKPYKLTADTGLYIRVAISGEKRWIIKYVVDGKQREARLPKPYGNSGEGFMTLSDATAENARVQALARDGIDFQLQATEAKAAAAAEIKRKMALNSSVRQMFDSWIADGVTRKDGNAELHRSFEKDVLPTIGDKFVKDLTEHDLRALLRAMVERGVTRMATRVYNDLVQLFAWAEKRQPWRTLMIEGNAADLLEIDRILPVGTMANAERTRIFSPDEIRELRNIFATMDADYEAATNKRAASKPLKTETKIAMWLCLSTACRIGELLQARWEHLDIGAGVWRIPVENTKQTNGEQQDHIVYLSDFASRQFESLRRISSEDSKWCFPARNATVGDNHVCIKSFSKQIGDRQMQFKDRKPLKNRKNDNSLVISKGRNGEWTPHDLRRTAATMMQSLGVSLDVIDRCQNHIIAGSKVRRHYMHYDYAKEKADAWCLLGARIDSILTVDNVVSLDSQR
jgi:integrase